VEKAAVAMEGAVRVAAAMVAAVMEVVRGAAAMVAAGMAAAVRVVEKAVVKGAGMLLVMTAVGATAVGRCR
jgi:hypothetical protein